MRHSAWYGPILICAAAFAAETAKDRFTPAQRRFWSFQPVKAPPPPALEHPGWAANPIDAFVGKKLEERGLEPNPAADRVTLLRRVSFDLIGMPPTPAEVEAFLNDKSPQAYEQVVDRLLASPHYGERWARHWLDLARYAESEGFKADETRPNAWRYRDYVIKSFNENKPYDRFVKEQLAGDELYPNDPWARVATAFNRHYPDESNARVLAQRRQEILNDITDTVGSTFLAMTYGCARCHDHKFDPILHTDYYKLQAFFANTSADDRISMISPEALAQWQVKRTAWEEASKPVRVRIEALLAPKKAQLLKDFVDKYPPDIQAVLEKPPAERTPFEWMMYAKAKPYLTIDDSTAAKALDKAGKTQYGALLKEMEQFASLDPGEAPTGIGIRDLGVTAPPTNRLNVGAWDAPLEEVKPGFLEMIDPSEPRITPSATSTGRRTALANWIASPTNPLTARVMVNRIWHYHFGQGIVKSPSDFGVMGSRPSHPELLDYLANDFTSNGWDIKRMHKLILMSNTYRQASVHNELSAKKDPSNKYLWRFDRQRLEGEVIRDSALSVSGLLNAKMGGPSVFPELPEGAGNPRGGWKVSAGDERHRRSIYVFVRRNARYPMLEAFDMPDTHESCGRRNHTINAPQAMSLLNSKVSLEWAQAFAGRLVTEAGGESRSQVDLAYRLAFSRAPDSGERDTALTFFETQKRVIAERIEKNEKIALPSALPADFDKVQGAALVDLCQMILNSNEFVYRN
jgi:hypothetical protein